MSEPVIQIESLGKRYRLGASHRNEPTLGEAVYDALGRGWAKLRGREATRARRHFWALDDVNLTVQPGEVVGLVGHNGAGKSTLLKLLSRITPPTRGAITLRGRVGSLLEVGTGFHPELTGRENIYLNGAILGMRRGEIRRKFDAIVDFAEIGRFIDTPVKRYSSGMYVRLAFAVAAHLEPEILLVDEVLAVGDAAFQSKCLGKMGDVARAGRTILFVSHNMKAVRSLCHRAVLLDNGRLVDDGDADTVTQRYLQAARPLVPLDQLRRRIAALPSDDSFRLIDVQLTQGGSSAGVARDTIGNGSPLHVTLTYDVLRPTTGLRVYLDLCDEYNDLLLRSFHDERAAVIPTMQPGRYVSTATIPAHLLAPRAYALVVQAGVYNVRSCLGGGLWLPLRVEQTGQINLAYASDPVRSKLQPAIDWRTTSEAAPRRAAA